MAICTSRGAGGYQAMMWHSCCFRRTHKFDGSSRGIIECPGAGGTESSYITNSAADFAMVQAVVESGRPIISFESEHTWGNATAQGRVTDLRTFAQSTFGYASGKVNLIGGSMGGLIALNWAKANPTLVQSIALIIPAVNPQDIYDNNRGGYAAEISTAWGGRPSDANTPAKNAASFTAIPTKVWYSTNDPICIASEATTFASAAGAETQSLGAVGHGASSMVPQDFVDFFAAHG